MERAHRLGQCLDGAFLKYLKKEKREKDGAEIKAVSDLKGQRKRTIRPKLDYEKTKVVLEYTELSPQQQKHRIDVLYRLIFGAASEK